MSFFISERFSKWLISTGIVLILVFLVLFLYKSILFQFDQSIDTEIFGQFGDVFGGVIGSVWALAGVILFYTGLNEQRKDIRTNQKALEKQIEAMGYQRQEMELQRGEYIQARKVFKEQAKSLRTQQFESNFYSLLTLYISVKKRLEDIDSDVFEEIATEVHASDNLTVYDKTQEVVERYLEAYGPRSNSLSQYFKTVYRVYKSIDEQTDFDDNDKYFYSKIVRSQISDSELLLLYFNAHSPYGANFRHMIIKYNIFKHLPLDSKKELSVFASDAPSASSFRSKLVSELDSFLSTSLDRLFDIDIEDSGSSTEFHDAMIIVTLNESGRVCLIFEGFDNSLLDRMDLVGRFESYIQHYLVDRLYRSYFDEASGVDIVQQDSSDSEYRFEFPADKNHEILMDAY